MLIVGSSGLFNHASDIDKAWALMSQQIIHAKSEVLQHA